MKPRLPGAGWAISCTRWIRLGRVAGQTELAGVEIGAGERAGGRDGREYPGPSPGSGHFLARSYSAVRVRMASTLRVTVAPRQRRRPGAAWLRAVAPRIRGVTPSRSQWAPPAARPPSGHSLVEVRSSTPLIPPSSSHCFPDLSRCRAHNSCSRRPRPRGRCASSHNS